MRDADDLAFRAFLRRRTLKRVCLAVMVVSVISIAYFWHEGKKSGAFDTYVPVQSAQPAAQQAISVADAEQIDAEIAREEKLRAEQELPDKPVKALEESMRLNPPTPKELWGVGPVINMRAPYFKDHEHGNYWAADRTEDNLRIAYLSMSFPDKEHPDVSDILAIWKYRLTGVFRDSEVDAVHDAAANAEHWFVRHREIDGVAAVGRVIVTVRRFNSGIRIWMRWADLLEPEAKRAFHDSDERADALDREAEIKRAADRKEIEAQAKRDAVQMKFPDQQPRP